MHMLWTWGYTRAAIKLRAVVSIDENSIVDSSSGEGEEDGARDTLRLSVRIRRSIDAGSAIALSGALMAAIGAQQVCIAVALRGKPGRGQRMPRTSVHGPCLGRVTGCILCGKVAR
jgi:hypothetical protein